MEDKRIQTEKVIFVPTTTTTTTTLIFEGFRYIDTESTDESDLPSK